MELFKKFLKEEEGMATLEVGLIVMVLLGMLVLFKKPIESFFKSVMSNITDSTNELLQSPSGEQ